MLWDLTEQAIEVLNKHLEIGEVELHDGKVSVRLVRNEHFNEVTIKPYANPFDDLETSGHAP